MASPADPLLSVRDLRTSFPIRSALLQRKAGAVQAVAGRLASTWPRAARWAWSASPARARPRSPAPVIGLEKPESGTVQLRRPRPAGPARCRVAADPPADPDGLPGPVRVAQPAAHRRADHQRGRGDQPRRACRATSGPAEVKDLLDRVGLNPDHADRYPHQFSGGQRQRVGIAPRPGPAAPPGDLRRGGVGAGRLGAGAGAQPARRPAGATWSLTYLFIAHDLSVVRHLVRRGRGDVSRQGRRDGAPGGRSSPRRCTRTPRPCSPRCR